jgi:hypothetical protein
MVMLSMPRMFWILPIVFLSGCEASPSDEEAGRREACSSVVSPMVERREELATALSERNLYGIAAANAAICVEHTAYVSSGNPRVTADNVLAQCSSDVQEYLKDEVYRLNNPPSQFKFTSDEEGVKLARDMLRLRAESTLQMSRLSQCWRLIKSPERN